MGGVIVNVTSSLSRATSSDDYDVLIIRDLSMIEPADDWKVYNEQLVCACSPITCMTRTSRSFARYRF